MCGNVFCRYCASETWPLPKFEYLSPVRVCRKCARLCWKAEALVQAIQVRASRPPTPRVDPDSNPCRQTMSTP